jgi:hypothetical protein
MKLRCAVAVSLVVPFLAVFLFTSEIRATGVSPVTKAEIEHLLSYMGQCGCRFCRNDTWYGDPQKIRDHVERKYNYFMKKGQIESAEDFITWSASKSEISGKPYLVQCGNAAPFPVSQWLTRELERYRKNANRGAVPAKTAGRYPDGLQPGTAKGE